MSKHVVIVGAGFGGVYALKRLHHIFHGSDEIRVTVINPTNYFLFTPLLHEVATGGVAPENAVEPLRKALGCCLTDLLLSRVLSIDLSSKQIVLSGVKKRLTYDYLILATGAGTEYHNVTGAEKNTFALKSLSDAYYLKNHIIQTMEGSRLLPPDKRRAEVTFTVVGGGPTGVELAGELVDFLCGTFSKFYPEATGEARPKIVLLQRGESLLSHLPQRLRERALDVLRQKGVDVRLGVSVQRVEKKKLVLSSGEELETNTVIWAAGVRPNLPEIIGRTERDPRGRLLVESTLRLKGQEDVFAVGDIAASADGRSWPATAQAATQAARVAADNVAASLRGGRMKSFKYRHRGDLVSVGQWQAVADVYGMNFTGRFAWWLWRTVYLSKMLSWSKKAKVALDWTTNLFLPRDISQL